MSSAPTLEIKCSRLADEKFSVKDEEYLAVSVKVGGFDHILTTDLFNQLVFFHEVFMNEVIVAS